MEGKAVMLAAAVAGSLQGWQGLQGFQGLQWHQMDGKLAGNMLDGAMLPGKLLTMPMSSFAACYCTV